MHHAELVMDNISTVSEALTWGKISMSVLVI